MQKIMEKSIKSMQNSFLLIKVENQFLILSAKLKNYITHQRQWSKGRLAKV